MKTDGWKNFFTLSGTRRDRTLRGSFQGNRFLDRETLDSLYSNSGIAQRLIDVYVKDALREGFFTDDEKAELLQDRFEEISLEYFLFRFLSASRLHGGAILLFLVDDGRSLTEPLNEANIISLEGFQVYDRWEVFWDQSMIYSDPSQKKYGDPEFYRISPYFGQPFKVHESRVFRLDGLVVSERKKRENQGWGFSFLQPVYQILSDLDSVHRSSASIVQDFVQTVMSVKGLTDMIGSGGEEAILKRLEILDMSRSVLNTLLMDADGEQFSKQSSSVAGLSDLLQSFRVQLSSASGIPMTKLFGTSPGGLNATGESDLRHYYDDISNFQKVYLKPVLERIVKLFFLEKKGPYKGIEPEKWSIHFNSLWQMDEKEKAEIKKIVAETDAIYLDRGVFREDEIAAIRSQPEGYKKTIEIEKTF